MQQNVVGSLKSYQQKHSPWYVNIIQCTALHIFNTYLHDIQFNIIIHTYVSHLCRSNVQKGLYILLCSMVLCSSGPSSSYLISKKFLPYVNLCMSIFTCDVPLCVNDTDRQISASLNTTIFIIQHNLCT